MAPVRTVAVVVPTAELRNTKVLRAEGGSWEMIRSPWAAVNSGQLCAVVIVRLLGAVGPISGTQRPLWCTG